MVETAQKALSDAQVVEVNYDSRESGLNHSLVMAMPQINACDSKYVIVVVPQYERYCKGKGLLEGDWTGFHSSDQLTTGTFIAGDSPAQRIGLQPGKKLIIVYAVGNSCGEEVLKKTRAAACRSQFNSGVFSDFE